MLWYKAWLETRWRFLIGLAILTILACGAILDYPAIARLNASVSSVNGTGSLGRLVNEALEAQRTYRGFIWFQWYRQSLAQTWAIFAVLLGSGGLLARTSGGALFTLSMPASRQRLAGIRIATGLLELLALAVIPSLLVPLLSPVIGQRYAVTDAAIHSLCLFAAGALFFGLAFLLSTIFDDFWRPMLIAGAVAIASMVVDTFVGLPFSGIVRVMSAESYFRSGQLPWVGLGVSVTTSIALLYGGVAIVERRDF